MTGSYRALTAGAVAAIAGLHLMWGGNPVAIKLALSAFGPMWTGFFRFLLGIACIAVWAWLRGIRIWPTAGEWKVLWLLSVMFSVQIGALNVGLELTTGAMGAILIATNPLFAAMFAHLFLRGDRMSWPKFAGLVIALGGTAAVIAQGHGAELSLAGWGNWILLFSAALLGGRLIFSAFVLQNIDEVRVNLWQMALALPVFLVAAVAWDTIDWDAVGWLALGGLAYTGAVVAGFGFMALSYLIKRYPPSVVVSFNFLSPISGVLLSTWLLGEAVTAVIVVGVVLVAIGLYLVTRER